MEYSFLSFSQFLECLQTTKSAPVRRSALRELFDGLRMSSPLLIAVVMRLLCPKESAAYGIQHKTLANFIVDALGVPRKSRDGQALRHWTAPLVAPHAQETALDFASLAEQMVMDRMPQQPMDSSVVNAMPGGSCIGPSICEVDFKLQSIKNDKETITWALNNLPPQAFKWFLRLVLKDLFLHVSLNTVMNAYHKDAYKVWAVTSSFDKVASLLHDRNAEMPVINLQTFTPFLPMLAARPSSLSALPGMLNSFHVPYFVQHKIDGERILVHVKENNVKVYSRHGTDWTPDYSLSWIPNILPITIDLVTEVVLDGEMVAVDTSGIILPFGTLRSAQKWNTNTHPLFYVFDVVVVNGENLLNVSQRGRLKVLKDILNIKPRWIEILPCVECNNEIEVLQELRKIYNSIGEGIVVKDPLAAYVPGIRSRGWVKVKVDYATNMLEEMKLALVGGWWSTSSGHRRKLTQYLFAVRTVDGRYSAIASVSAGLTKYEMYQVSEHVKRQLPANYDPTVPAEVPAWLDVGDNVPDVFVLGINQIYEIIAAEIVPSSQHPLGLSLRFPRIKSKRYDLSLNDCMTVCEFLDLSRITGGRLVKEPTGDIFKIKKKTSKRRRLVYSTNLLETGPVELCENLFLKDKNVWLIFDKTDAKEIKEILLKRGAKVVLSSNLKDNVMIVADDSKNVQKIIKLESWDIYSFDYILECHVAGKILNPAPHHFVYMSEQTKKIVYQVFDEYGDKFLVDTTVDELKLLLERESVNCGVDYSSIQYLHTLFKEIPGRWFAGMCVYVQDNSYSCMISRAKLVFYGAIVFDEYSEEATHVLCDDESFYSLPKISPLWVTKATNSESICNN